MQKESTKNLKYYWDNRYSYIVNFGKTSRDLFISSMFIKKYIYFLIPLFLFLLTMYSKLFSLLNARDYYPLYIIKLNELITFFYLSVFLFICFFLFLFFCFSKKKILQLTVFGALIILLLSFIWGFNAWLWRPISNDALFLLKIPYDIIVSYNLIYLESLISALSLNAIIFYFMKEKHFKKNEENSFNNLTFIIFTLFWILLPYLTYLTTSSTFLTPNILN